MRFHYLVLFLPVLCFSLPVTAQEVVQEGIRLGNFALRPEANALLGYDNRASFDNVDAAEGDIYGEISAGASLYNLPAAHSLSADARYGYRYYDQFDDFNDDFYNAGASVGSSESALEWGLSGDVEKSLDYNTFYDPDTGEGPDSILSDQPNKRWTARGNVGYAIPLSEKTFFVPGYSLEHYYHEFEGSDTAEWQTHNASLLLRHVLTERTTLLAGGFYTLQANDEENGYIVTAGIGAEGRISDKTSWQALVGVAHVDYDYSGADEGGVADLRAQWQATEKLSTYVFYSNTYEPGYGGGRARMVYRAGYGGGWQFTPRWSLGGQVLHDYTDEVGSGADTDVYGGTRHFFTAHLAYNPTRRLSATFRAQYINDQYSIDQKLVSLGLGYVY